MAVGTVIATAMIAAACASSLPVVEEAVAREVSAAGGPPAAFFRADDLSAAEMLYASDLAMRTVSEVRVAITQTLPDGSVSSTAERRPDLSHDVKPDECDLQSVIRQYADRSAGGLGRQCLDPAFERGVTPAIDIRFIGEAAVDGVDAWVLWYRFEAPSVEGPFTRWRTEWIAKSDLRLLRQVEENDDPYAPRVPVRTDAHLTFVR